MRQRISILIAITGVLTTVFAQPSWGADSGSFVDDDNSRFESYIETASKSGLVTSCNPPENDRFCPQSNVTRGEMAMMLARALELEPGGGDHYSDDDGHPAEAALESLRAHNVTFGCGPRKSCPDRSMARAEMAMFIARSFGWQLAYRSHQYTDVPGTARGEALVELAWRGGLEPCDQPIGSRLCPGARVSRAEAAYAMVAAAHITPSRISHETPEVPAIDFGDDFNSLRLWDGGEPSERNRVRLTRSGVRGSGARVTIPAGSHYGADFRLDLSNIVGEEPDLLFFRYYLRLDADWRTASSGKLPGFSGVYGTSGKGGYRSTTSTPGWSARLQFFGPRENDSRTWLGYYVYHLGQVGEYGDGLGWNQAGMLQPGQWYCLEGEIRLNSLGVADGRLRSWVDGTPAFDATGLAFRRNGEPEIKIESFWFNVYYGGKSVPDRDLGLTIDEVAVDTSRIGCGAGGGTERVVSGDFSGDGYTDEIRWRSCPSGMCFWLRTPSVNGSRLSALADSAWYSLETHRLGFSAGDFDGDGRDDLVYPGRCDQSVRCWRVHRSQRSSLGTGENWGNGSRFSSSTEAVVTGDWNGDGRDDLVYQGLCGEGAETCWRVHPSRGSRFARPSDWGSTPNETVVTLSGDIDGDGLDDLIYPASCETGRCWYLQRSSGKHFGQAQPLGGVLAGETEQSYVFDYNGDGQDDLVSVITRNGASRVQVRLFWANRLTDSRTVARFSTQVEDLSLRRLHDDLPGQLLVELACGRGDVCMRYMVAPTPRIERGREHIGGLMISSGSIEPHIS